MAGKKGTNPFEIAYQLLMAADQSAYACQYPLVPAYKHDKNSHVKPLINKTCSGLHVKA